jgi:predicted TIM-barrel fold metal-dependent hydrolase
MDRILFGSDYPLDDPSSAIKAISGMGLTKSKLRDVFYGNVVSLFEL